LRGRYGDCGTGLGLHSRSYLCHHIPSDEKIIGHVVEKKCTNIIARVFNVSLIVENLLQRVNWSSVVSRQNHNTDGAE
jgi:hypothetical protein